MMKGVRDAVYDGEESRQLIVSANKEISAISKESSAGFVLIFSAGWLNIVGIKLAFFDSVSFVTGRGIRIGMAMFEGDFWFLSVAFATLTAFIFGSFCGSKLTKNRGMGYGLLLTTASIVICGLLYAGDMLSDLPFDTYTAMTLLPFGMGSMNASTSLTRIGRTTHLTGPATDIGMNLALGKYKTAAFWAIRWIGFFMGAFMAMMASSFITTNDYPVAMLFLLPALIVGAEAVYHCVYPKRIEVR